MAISANSAVSNKSQALSFDKGEVSLMTANDINLSGLTDAKPSNENKSMARIADMAFSNRRTIVDYTA